MSQHSSLKSDSVGSRHRNVLKRHERLKELSKNHDGNSPESVYKLPKMKLIKIKVKKEKSAKEGTEAAAPGAATPAAAAAPAGAAKPAAGAAKPAEKAKGK